MPKVEPSLDVGITAPSFTPARMPYLPSCVIADSVGALLVTAGGCCAAGGEASACRAAGGEATAGAVVAARARKTAAIALIGMFLVVLELVAATVDRAQHGRGATAPAEEVE